MREHQIGDRVRFSKCLVDVFAEINLQHVTPVAAMGTVVGIRESCNRVAVDWDAGSGIPEDWEPDWIHESNVVRIPDPK